MKHYKDTLNLPKTLFPMKANLAQREPDILRYWQSLDLYAALRGRGKNKPRFTLHDGPPYANARPHMGTALNKILKDMVCKSKTLSGYDVAFIPGWDCHGLPIELNVEKKVGKVGEAMDVVTFRKHCRDYAASQVALQKNDFERMGVLADWQHPYLTMDYRYEANIIRSLALILKKGHLFQGEKPVHWCPLCASALAEAEVEYQSKISPAIDVAFRVIDTEKIAQAFGISSLHTQFVTIPIWTTTPWTLPANQAVAVHEKVEYQLIQAGRMILVLAKKLAQAALTRYGLHSFEVLAQTEGLKLEHIRLQHPLFKRQVPVILAPHVTTETGTGHVHIAPAHGLDDFMIGQKYRLSLDSPINTHSCFYSDVPEFGGLHIYKANEAIIDWLKKHHSLLAYSTLEHSYPHCWRHQSPLIFRATPQWFISMDQQHLRQAALKAIKENHWQPSWGKKRMAQMVSMRPDWCISRQRTWGVPITLFIHKKTRQCHPQSIAWMYQIADQIEQQGIKAWYTLKPESLLKGQVDDYEKVTDILDVWFDSGVSHYAVLSQQSKSQFPADLCLEGSDQYRGWFQSSLLTSLAINQQAPFKKVITHGFVVDAKGQKMSKSRGNTASPSILIDQIGADILRLWIASSDYQNDIRFSDAIVKQSTEAYRRIRNTARFLLSNLYDFDHKQHLVTADQLLEIDAWVIKTACILQNELIQDYEACTFHQVYQKIYHFCTADLGSFYLDVIKDRQYTEKADSPARRSAQTAMYHLIQAFTRWLAPILSFTAEEIWQCLKEPEPSVFLTQWYLGLEGVESDLAYWAQLIQVRDEVNKMLEIKREQEQIASALDAKITLYAEGKLLNHLQRLGDELRYVLITSQALAKPLSECPNQINTRVWPNLAIQVEVASAKKCQRCWQRREDVGTNSQHAALCRRCVLNISEEAVCMDRRFA